MPRTTAIIRVSASAHRIYEYLRNRYDGYVCKAACLAAKGYVPQYECVEEVEDAKLRFWAAGRDALFRFSIGGWKWSYELKALSEAETEVTICYEWSSFMSVMSFWTVRHQAANELVETAMALEALASADS